jgi:hypothetical protein
MNCTAVERPSHKRSVSRICGQTPSGHKLKTLKTIEFDLEEHKS